MAKKKRRTVPRPVPEDLGSDIEDRDEALQPDLTEAERNRQTSGEARAARHRDNTYHDRNCRLAHLTDHLTQELWDAFLERAARPRVEACSERAIWQFFESVQLAGIVSCYVTGDGTVHVDPMETIDAIH
ncbi:hypothetical protein V8C86DRAFT_3032082 [Haematococcus lacustris]